MSALREFKRVSMFHGQRRVAGIEIVCRCGQTAQHNRGSTKSFVGPGEEMKRFKSQFQRQGWRVGDRPQDDRCPKCLEEIFIKPKLAIVAKPKEKPMSPAPAVAAQAAVAVQSAPPVPTREDNRIIHQHLDEHYDHKAQRYSGDWTDARVATNLGIPRVWVENIRKMFFGPEGSNQEIAAAISEASRTLALATTLLANTEKAITDARATLGSLDAERQRLADVVGRIERKIETIEKSVRP